MHVEVFRRSFDGLVGEALGCRAWRLARAQRAHVFVNGPLRKLARGVNEDGSTGYQNQKAYRFIGESYE